VGSRGHPAAVPRVQRLRGDPVAIGHTAAAMSDDAQPVRILWGRVAALAGVVAAAFVLGLLLGGGGDAEDELAELRGELAEARDERDEALEQLEALAADDPGPGDDEADEDDEAEDGEDAEDAENGGEAETDEADEDPELEEEDQVAGDPEPATDTEPDPDAGLVHTVEPGESLYGLAERFYGDGDQFRRIAEANGLDPAEPLPVGSDLVIPDP